MKKRLSTTMMAMVMALGLVFAAGSAWAEDPNDAITFTMDLAPVITIGSGSTANTTKAISANDGSAVANTAWLVTSNNGFTVSFDGDALSDDGTTALGESWFTKRDVNASGAPQTGYDHLTTSFAVEINSGYFSVSDLFVTTSCSFPLFIASPAHFGVIPKMIGI